MGRITATLLLAGLLTVSSPSQAAATCSAAAGVMMVGYLVTNALPTDQNVDLIVTCRRSGGPASITIEVAVGPSQTSNSIASRKMSSSSSSDLADYNLYREVARQSVWGNTSGVNTSTQTLSVPNNSSATSTFTIFGRMPALQNLTPGTYTDAVTVSVTP